MGCSASWIALLTMSLHLAFSRQQVLIVDTPPGPPQCRPLDPSLVPFCAAMPYNTTFLPNSRGHQSLQDASAELQTFRRLILTKCSGAIVHFLCSVYTPPCYRPATDRGSQPPMALPPCRSLCLVVRDRCERYLLENSLSWPPQLVCENFPDRTDSMCFGPPNPSSLSIPDIPSLNTLPSLESTTPVGTSERQSRLCNPLQEMPMCTGLGYHNFSLPNFRGHRLISAASQELSLFKLFIQTRCSQAIAHFLCYYYAPPCSSHPPYPLPPCRELCEFSRQECLPVLERLGLHWPRHMNCDRFPLRNTSSCSGPRDPRTLRIPSDFFNKSQPTVPDTESTSSALGVIWHPVSVTVTVLMSVAVVLYIQ